MVLTIRAALLTPMYLSVSWVLTVTYQFFTETAVRSISTYVGLSLPAASTWLNTNVETITFIYAFTWIFVLSSVIPSALLGKQRSVLIQYGVVLTLTLIAFFMADILQAVAGIQMDTLLNAAVFFTNPILAGIYLAMPYLFMVALDVYSRNRDKSEREKTNNRILSEWEKIRK